MQGISAVSISCSRAGHIRNKPFAHFIPRPFSILFRILCFFLITWGPAEALSAQRAPLKPEPHYAQIAKRFARQFPKEHLTHNHMDDTISSRTWTNYLSSLDYDHTYFLASDIARFKTDELNLDDRLKNGNTSFAYDIFDIFKERVSNRCDYVRLLLDSGFDLEKEESYKWNRKDAPWPRDETEWNEIWRKKIKNEYLQLVVAGELATREEVRSPAVGGINQRLAPPQAGSEVRENKEQKEQDQQTNLLSPEESISKRYKQFFTVLDDSDSEWVLQRYMSAFSRAYDPHSDYMSPSTVEDFNIQMRLSLVGIGALLRAEDGAAKVVRIIPGGPAHCDKREKRLRPGDKIIAVGQGDDPPVDVLHWSLRKIVERIRGKKGTKVVLVVIPASDPTGSTTKHVDLTRDEVKLEEQAASLKIEEVRGDNGVTRKLAVITLPTFYANVKTKLTSIPEDRSSSHDVKKILGEMKGKGVEGLLLDLRNNGGGYLPEAVKMTGLFIGTGPTVQVKQKHHDPQPLDDEDPAVAYSGPLVILVNRLSASASEIVAGALQDYGRAVIVGDSKTHGKGTVQAVLHMGHDKRMGSVKITSAMYYRISGSPTQLKGVSPDIVVSSPFDRMDFGEDNLLNPIRGTPVEEATYSPVRDLGPVISLLNEKSEKRRAANPSFAAYAKLLDRIDAINRAKELPLNISKRKELAKTEKELHNLQREVLPGDEDNRENGQDRSPDLVFTESLKILSDLIEIQEKEPETPRPPVKPARKGFLERVAEWFQ